MGKEPQKELDSMNEELKQAGEEAVTLEDDENLDEDDQQPEKKNEAGESDEEDEEESDDDDEEESDEETDDESDESDDDDDSKTDDEDDEEEVDLHQPRKRVPLRRYQNDIRRAREETEYWKDRALKAPTAKVEEEKKEEDELKETIRSLAAELKTPEDQTEKLVTTIVNLARKNAIPPELQERLDRFEKSERDQEVKQAFQDEWDGFAPVIQKEYPNATAEQLAIAREAMDIIAHSKRFHGIPDLEYIFSKTRDDFEEILFSPKKKGFESSRISGADSRRDRGDKELSIPDPNSATPESIAALEQFLNEAEEAEGNEGIDATLPDGTPTRLK